MGRDFNIYNELTVEDASGGSSPCNNSLFNIIFFVRAPKHCKNTDKHEASAGQF